MVKVSVVVPTYCSGAGLDRAIASLDRQTMPQDDLEVLLLDDGSPDGPDGTAQRIADLAAARPNYRAFALEASGWPSRPRNVGVREARGEYVCFLDHDDELYPGALQRAYRMARAHDADVVNGKEVRTHRPSWGLSVFTEDLPDATALPARGLLPMTPHKLYRRRFLLDHDIRFPEGPRHIWEDVFFNVDVARHLPRVAVLSSAAFYHWHETGENNSAAADGSRLDYGGDPEYWPYLDKLLRRVAAIPHRALREELLAQNAGVRLVPQLGRRLATLDDAGREAVVAHVRHALASYVPPEVDALMAPRSRAAVALFRAGEVAACHELLCHGDGHRPRATLTGARPDGDGLLVTGELVWTAAEDADPLLVRSPDRPDRPDRPAVRPFSPALTAALARLGLPGPAEPPVLEVRLLTRRRRTRATWATPARAELRLEPAGDDVLATAARFTARLDPAHGAAGGRLPDGRYDVLVLATLDGRQSVTRAVPSGPSGASGPSSPGAATGVLTLGAGPGGNAVLDVRRRSS